MPEKEPSAHESEGEVKPPMSEPVKLAMIEHWSRPFAIMFVGLLLIGWLSCNRDLLFDTLGRAKTLKVGLFEITLAERAQAAEVQSELRNLEQLTDEQLQLFLVIGRNREHIEYSGREITSESLMRLQDLELLTGVAAIGEKSFRWSVTEKAHRLHGIIFDLLLDSIRRSSEAARQEAS